MTKSPYMEKYRLADVVAAIQVMGTYRVCKLEIGEWASRLSPEKGGDNITHWENVFSEHREFFFIENGRACLLLRKSIPKLYHIKDQREYGYEMYDASTKEQQEFFTNRPLNSDEVSDLVKVAISMHESSISMAREIRWLTIPLIGIFGIIIGNYIRYLPNIF